MFEDVGAGVVWFVEFDGGFGVGLTFTPDGGGEGGDGLGGEGESVVGDGVCGVVDGDDGVEA